MRRLYTELLLWSTPVPVRAKIMSAVCSTKGSGGMTEPAAVCRPTSVRSTAALTDVDVLTDLTDSTFIAIWCRIIFHFLPPSSPLRAFFAYLRSVGRTQVRVTRYLAAASQPLPTSGQKRDELDLLARSIQWGEL